MICCVIACFNESQRIWYLLDILSLYTEYEVIVVDDGSDGYMGWGRMLKNDSILVDRNYTVHINSENENELKQIEYKR